MISESALKPIQLDRLHDLPEDACASKSLALIHGTPESYPAKTLKELAEDFETAYFVRNVETVDFSDLDGITELEKFAVIGFELTTEETHAIANNLINLLVLNLENNRIAAAGLRSITALDQLTTLNVCNNGVGRAVSSLSECKKLTKLNISHNSLGGKKFLDIGAVKGLKTLTADSCHIYSKNLHVLNQLKDLTHLSLADNGIDDDAVELLGSLPSLQTLDLTKNPISDAGSKKLGMLQNLTTVLI